MFHIILKLMFSEILYVLSSSQEHRATQVSVDLWSSSSSLCSSKQSQLLSSSLNCLVTEVGSGLVTVRFLFGFIKSNLDFFLFIFFFTKWRVGTGQQVVVIAGHAVTIGQGEDEGIEIIPNKR